MKIKLLQTLLVLAIILSSSSNSFGKYVRTATVKYEQQYGWSKKYTVDVIFMSGYELNQATRSYNYSSYSIYATIFWGQNQATVIKLSSYLTCGTEVTEDCIENSIYDLKGVDQDGDKWNICLSDYCY